FCDVRLSLEPTPILFVTRINASAQDLDHKSRRPHRGRRRSHFWAHERRGRSWLARSCFRCCWPSSSRWRSRSPVRPRRRAPRAKPKTTAARVKARVRAKVKGKAKAKAKVKGRERERERARRPRVPTCA